MTAHTPGPWRITGPNIRADTALGTGALVAVVKDHFADVQTREAEKEANARLLAASPDLLQVARDYVLLCELFDWDGLVFQSAVAAIAKAEGGE